MAFYVKTFTQPKGLRYVPQGSAERVQEAQWCTHFMRAKNGYQHAAAVTEQCISNPLAMEQLSPLAHRRVSSTRSVVGLPFPASPAYKALTILMMRLKRIADNYQSEFVTFDEGFYLKNSDVEISVKSPYKCYQDGVQGIDIKVVTDYHELDDTYFSIVDAYDAIAFMLYDYCGYGRQMRENDSVEDEEDAEDEEDTEDEEEAAADSEPEQEYQPEPSLCGPHISFMEQMLFTIERKRRGVLMPACPAPDALRDLKTQLESAGREFEFEYTDVGFRIHVNELEFSVVVPLDVYYDGHYVIELAKIQRNGDIDVVGRFEAIAEAYDYILNDLPLIDDHIVPDFGNGGADSDYESDDDDL
jgi:hypothetical protein